MRLFLIAPVLLSLACSSGGAGSEPGGEDTEPGADAGGSQGTESQGTESQGNGNDGTGTTGGSGVDSDTAVVTSTDSDTSGAREGSTGRVQPDDEPGELVFEAPDEVEGGWYQSSQGSNQYRASGAVFALAQGEGVNHVVHASSSTGIRYVEDSKGAWNSPPNLTDPDIAYGPNALGIALDSELLPSITLAGQHSFVPPFFYGSVHAYFYDGYLWNVAHPVPSTGGQAPRSGDVVIDAEDRRHIVYVAQWQGIDNSLIYATADAEGSDWTLEPIETTYELTSLATNSAALALDVDGGVHVVYTRDNPDAVGNEGETIISYAYKADAGAAWAHEIAEDYLVVRDRIDLAVTEDGVPHVVFAESMYSELWYATREGGEWTSELVDDEDDIGWGHSIAVDVYGRPHVAYVDRPEGRIRYARRLESGWDRYAPADTYADGAGFGSCGYCNTAIKTDLVLDADARPTIAVGGFDLSVVRADVP